MGIRPMSDALVGRETTVALTKVDPVGLAFIAVSLPPYGIAV